MTRIRRSGILKIVVIKPPVAIGKLLKKLFKIEDKT